VARAGPAPAASLILSRCGLLLAYRAKMSSGGVEPLGIRPTSLMPTVLQTAVGNTAQILSIRIDMIAQMSYCLLTVVRLDGTALRGRVVRGGTPAHFI